MGTDSTQSQDLNIHIRNVQDSQNSDCIKQKEYVEGDCSMQAESRHNILNLYRTLDGRRVGSDTVA